VAIPDWQWNEMQHVGTDYNDLVEVQAYDARMASFRNVAEENRRILQTLNLPKGAAVLEIGCGTGQFARSAAAAGLVVDAADVSALMLEYVKKRSQEEGHPVRKLQHAGFLTMDFPAGYFDAVVSGAALHDLPDAWKLVALRNVARAMKNCIFETWSFLSLHKKRRRLGLTALNHLRPGQYSVWPRSLYERIKAIVDKAK
jgi:ubiquinone/menaquinone biosynthesis C-methylase UbiE